MVIRDVINLGWNFAGHFNHSMKGNKLLREKQAYTVLPNQHIFQEVLTRWDSTYLMLQKLLEHQLTLHKFSSVSKLGIEAPLGSAQWDMIALNPIYFKTFHECHQPT